MLLKVSLIFTALAVGASASLAQELNENNASHPRVALGVAYVYSRWSDISPTIKDGSLALNFEFSAEFFKNVETGLALSLYQGYSQSRSEENVNAYTIGLQSHYFFSSRVLRPYAGGTLNFGGYRAWTVASDNPSSITYDKFGSGALIGLSPEIGLRWNVGRRFYADLRASYVAFINGTQASKVGGFSLGAMVGVCRD